MQLVVVDVDNQLFIRVFREDRIAQVEAAFRRLYCGDLWRIARPASFSVGFRRPSIPTVAVLFDRRHNTSDRDQPTQSIAQKG
ncbi:hypothetical protein [Anatilimnocola aggregata]|uniref:hypothetical protein n=1 Tax=Anatilimnocola aggregata TaxID=2528021 RepID=UPI0011A5E460|nr:hypothetical protein [Anatilimnocola aggregata]